MIKKLNNKKKNIQNKNQKYDKYKNITLINNEYDMRYQLRALKYATKKRIF